MLPENMRTAPSSSNVFPAASLQAFPLLWPSYQANAPVLASSLLAYLLLQQAGCNLSLSQLGDQRGSSSFQQEIPHASYGAGLATNSSAGQAAVNGEQYSIASILQTPWMQISLPQHLQQLMQGSQQAAPGRVQPSIKLGSGLGATGAKFVNLGVGGNASRAAVGGHMRHPNAAAVQQPQPAVHAALARLMQATNASRDQPKGDQIEAALPAQQQSCDEAQEPAKTAPGAAVIAITRRKRSCIPVRRCHREKVAAYAKWLSSNEQTEEANHHHAPISGGPLDDQMPPRKQRRFRDAPASTRGHSFPSH